MNTIQDKIEHSKDVIRQAMSENPRIAVASSFGKDSMVVLHLALEVDPNIKVFSVMTKFKPKETFEYKEKITKEWNLNIETFMSDVDVPVEMSRTEPDRCCDILKVEPTKRALSNLDAWITGLRRTEGRTRTDYEEVERSALALTRMDGKAIKTRITKINPILDWTETDIWKYIAMNSIPVHAWYKMGYRSLGCEPCTKLVDDEDTERAGRWAGTSKCGGECGIHTMHKDTPSPKTE